MVKYLTKISSLDPGSVVTLNRSVSGINLVDEGSPHLVHYRGFVGPVNQVFLVHHPDTRVIVVNLKRKKWEKWKIPHKSIEVFSFYFLYLTYKHRCEKLRTKPMWNWIVFELRISGTKLGAAQHEFQKI